MDVQISHDSAFKILHKADNAGIAWHLVAKPLPGFSAAERLELQVQSEDWVGPKPKIIVKKDGPAEFYLMDVVTPGEQMP